MADRIIMHCDCNAFFASVEEHFNPHLRDVPMAVAGDPERRHGIILAKNEKAKAFGIKTAESIWTARSKCPHLVLVPTRRDDYSRFNRKVNAIYEQYTPLVEQLGDDESFLDMTGCLRDFDGDGMRFAHHIRERIKNEVGITISIGVSWNKIYAKLGSDYKKPDAVTDINRDNYKDIVFPLLAGDLLSVGDQTAVALASCGIFTIGQLAIADKALLIKRFGKAGQNLYENANGFNDDTVAPVGMHEPIKSVGNGCTFPRDLINSEDIRTSVIYLADSVAGRLRRHGLKCRTVSVGLRDAQLKSITRQTSLLMPTCVARNIADTAITLITKHWPEGKPIRTLTITAQNLIDITIEDQEQLSLLTEPIRPKHERFERLERAIDGIRDRFGYDSIRQGILMSNDLGILDNDYDISSKPDGRP